MREFVAELFAGGEFTEFHQRLAVGLAPVDAARNATVAQKIRVALDSEPLDAVPPRPTRPRIERHASCRFVLRYQPAVVKEVTLRLYDPEYRFVPRRLKIAFRDDQQVNDGVFASRVVRPALFPGSAYEAVGGVTGVRGRVLRDSKPVRWARVRATLGATVLGTAHGDEHGEFFLIVSAGRPPVTPLPAQIPLMLAASGPAIAPVAPQAKPGKPGYDRLWGLPVEDTAQADVIDGTGLPPGYISSDPAQVDVTPGRVTTKVELNLPNP